MMDKNIKVGVVGAGTMGRGIAQLFAQSGFQVLLYDQSSEAMQSAIDNVRSMIDKLQAKGKISEDLAIKSKANVVPSLSLDDFAVCDLVIEAVVENVEIKQSVFKSLEVVVNENTILASNTSSLLIADVAANCQHPERIVGLHFFNPVPLMKVVEIIAAVRTESSVVDRLVEIILATGHQAVIAKDQPGFLINHAGRGLYTEGLAILEENVADVAKIDRILKHALGLKMGPFELLDLTGLDVSGPVMEGIYNQFFFDPLYRPSSLVAPRVSAGLHGRKTGEGWYSYRENKSKSPLNGPQLDKGTSDFSVWVCPSCPDYEELTSILHKNDISLSAEAGANDLLLVQFWGLDASEYARKNKLDATRLVAIDPLPELTKQRTLMVTPVTKSQYVAFAKQALSGAEVNLEVINDSPGFITQRVLATIINIAGKIAQRKIASTEDINKAVRTGLGYPRGPLEWGDQVGADRVYKILENLHEVTQDPRYKPSPWLRRSATLNIPLSSEQFNIESQL